MTQSIIDISKYQHPDGAAIDYQKVFDAGVRAVIIEARDEAAPANSYFAEDWRGFKAVGMGVGGYCYLRPDLAPEPQAADLLKILSFGGPAWGDIEAYGFTRELETAIMEKAPGAATYVPGYVLEAGAAFLLGWSAWTTKGSPLEKDAAILQVGTGTVPGIEGDVDIDTWECSDEAFEVCFRLKPPVASPPPLTLGEETVGMAGCSTGGYWIATANGAVYALGGAPYLGGLNDGKLPEPVVDIAACGPRGYWLVTKSGGVRSFGQARGAGGVPRLGKANQPIKPEP